MWPHMYFVKLNIHLFVVTYSLPESDSHCEHGGIGVTTFPPPSHRTWYTVRSCICVWWPKQDIFVLLFPLNRGFEGFEKINHHQIGTPTCIKKVTKIKKIKNKNFKYGVYMHYFDHTTDSKIKFFYFIRSLLLSKSPILAKSWCASLRTCIKKIFLKRT